MDYRTLIVQAETGDDGRSRIELALALALQFKAMLVGSRRAIWSRSSR